MMKKLLLTLVFGILGVGVYGQTIKSLGYNTTNGQIVAATNVVWTNAFSFSTNNVAEQVRTNLGLGWSALTNTNIANFRTAIGLGAGFAASESLRTFESVGTTTSMFISDASAGLFDGANDEWAMTAVDNEFQFNGNLRVTNFRSALGLGWSALTNSNAATSLLGITTNGQVIYSGTNTLAFTNSTTIGAAEAMNFTVTPTEITVYSSAAGENILTMPTDDVPIFSSAYYWNDPSIRAAFGFATNLNTLWTATNSSNVRTAVELGTTNNVTFGTILSGAANASFSQSPNGGVALGWQGTATRVTIDTSFSLNTAGLAFSFGTNNSTGAGITRTNLGLGGGITATNTFVSYNGTNYTTNSVTISNGIITGWTQ